MELVTKRNVSTTYYVADVDIYRQKDGIYGPKSPESHSLVARAGMEVSEEIYLAVTLQGQEQPIEVDEEPTVDEVLGKLEEEVVTVTVPPGKNKSPKAGDK